jgi:hypothetical protein
MLSNNLKLKFYNKNTVKNNNITVKKKSIFDKGALHISLLENFLLNIILN